MLVNRHDITQYVPQRNPIVMVHELVAANDEQASTSFTIEPGNIFLSNGYFAEPGLIENIAQTAAVQAGYHCIQNKIPVPIGYIAAVKNLKILNLPKENSVINTRVKVTNKVLDVTVIEGAIEQDGELMCSCEMRIFIRPQS
ncbi:MAG TPA: 3-hydroxyacyl-ACP dehydratase [Chryseolinea sp.]|nr:3-hydroxyacyl-ACP dehydratase [Chryseolinea sp.]HPM30280.1 3-hydroxyacyl-ACP dehydratase [Chryseolinea sp.]